MTAGRTRGHAVHLRDGAPESERTEEIAHDIGRIIEALHGARDRLDFNDEPARFEALVCSPPPVRRRMK